MDPNPTPPNTEGPAKNARIVYCHCAYSKVVPEDVKRAVLEKLSASGVAFDAVPDLCEASARKDPLLAQLSGEGELRIAACFPRAVRWLFHATGQPLAEKGVDILNMRESKADDVVRALLPQDAEVEA